MVPREFRKSLCIAAGLITLLEAGIWGAVSIYCIGIYHCGWTFFDNKGVSVWSMLDISYLMGGCQGSEAAQGLGYSFTPPSGPSASLQLWFWANTVLSLIWIPSCILLIAAVLAEVRGKHGALLYYPWEALTVVLIIFDFAGTVYHAADIFQTTTPDKYAQFTFDTSWDSLTLQSPSEGITTWLPSLFVSLFFCRFVVIWILNIFFVCAVYKASTAISAFKTKHLQSTLYNAERNKSWRDMLYNGSDQIAFQNQALSGSSNILNEADENRYCNPDATEEQIQPTKIDTHSTRQELHQTRHKKATEFGVPIEELNTQVQRSSASYLIKDHVPRSPYQQRRNVGHTSRPETPEHFNEHWKDIPPPMASEIKLPPELNKVRPFSYTAGDQPQLIKANISRSNSRAEYPPIPRPDYSLTDRRAASLEYIPNRFKVPSPKRPMQTQNAFNYDQHSPSQLKKAPIPPKKPHIHPRTTLPESDDIGVVTPSNYIHSQGQVVHSRQTSQNKSYNINKLY